MLKGWPRLSETFIAQELVALESRGIALRSVVDAPADRQEAACPSRRLAGQGALPARIPLRGAAARAEGRRALGPAARVWRGAEAVAETSAQRSDAQPRAPFRTGRWCLRAKRRRPEIPLRAFPAYAVVGRALCRPHARRRRGVFRPTRRTSGNRRNGKSATSLHAPNSASPARRSAPRICVRLSPFPMRLDLVYHGLDLVALSRASAAAPETRRIGRAGRHHLGRPAGRKEGLRPAARRACEAAAVAELAFQSISAAANFPSDSQARARKLGLSERIEWRGACDQAEVIDALRDADIFVLPSRIASDGDRDGLPNVLMEAASQELPILSTNVSSIPEFIENGKQGVLVEPDAEALAASARKNDRRSRRAREGCGGCPRAPGDRASGWTPASTGWRHGCALPWPRSRLRPNRLLCSDETAGRSRSLWRPHHCARAACRVGGGRLGRRSSDQQAAQP